MKKLIAIVLALCLCLSLVACASNSNSKSDNNKSDSNSNDTSSDVEIGDSGKIAVVRNMTASDHTTQYFAGIEAEGNALGYTVDTYISDGDDAKMQDLLDQCINKDYDIIIVSHANEGYQFDMVTRAKESGKVVVCFDCNGEHVEGVTYTSQGDKEMAQKCMENLTAALAELGGTEPYPVGEYTSLGMIIPFDLRGEVVQEWDDNGKIDLSIMAWDTNDTYNSVYTQVTKLMNDNPDTPVGVFFAACGLGDTAAQDAINDAGRTDVVFTGVDISNEVIEHVRDMPAFLGVACCDPYVVGVINVRIAVLNSLGIETPEEFACTNVFVGVDDLQEDSTMQNLQLEGFGDSDDFKTEEIEELRAKFAGVQ